MQSLNLPSIPCWLQQVHGTTVLEASPGEASLDHESYPKADASYTHKPQIVCAVLTADCLPILLCNKQGTSVAAVHAGWRGLAAGVIEETLKKFTVSPDEILAWLGPAIGPQVFEVGPEVREQFMQMNAEAHLAFRPSPNPNRWLANIYFLAKQRLLKQGVNAIYGGENCTYSDTKQFYSYRREGEKTGRMASLIWLEHPSIERSKRLITVRKMTNLSRESIEQKYDLSASTLQAWETPKQGGLTQKGAKRIVEILEKEGIQCSTDWLLDGIGIGPQVIGADKSDSESALVSEILTFRTHNLDATDMVVKDDGMEPFYCIGDYVGGKQRQGDAIPTAIGKNCIVETSEGETLLRYLRSGSKPHHYTLLCLNAETTLTHSVLSDVELRSAAPVIWHRKKE